MNLLNGTDASNPTGDLGGQFVMFYIGGSTPHRWTQDQLRMQTAEFLVPIWTAGYDMPPGDAAVHCLDALETYSVPEDVAILLDAELLNVGDNGWIHEFGAETSREHYGVHIYDSVDRIFHFQPRSGYVVADWTGHRHQYEHPWVKGTQWENTSRYDRDVMDSTVRMWRNPYVR